MTGASPLKREAEAIIAGLALLDLAGRYGRAEVVGSVALDLIVKLDIDVHLLADTPDLLAVTDRIYHALLDHPRVQEVRITDYRAEAGVKIGIDAYDGPSGAWSIDIWVTDRVEATAFDDTRELRRCLTPAHRAAILAIKRAYHARHELHDGLSRRIYEAVVDKGVRSEDEFRRYLEWVRRGSLA
jgi:hypothetical protein